MNGVTQCYTFLMAMRNNLPGDNSSAKIPEKYAHDYNQIIDQLSANLNIDLNDYKFSTDRLERQLISIVNLNGLHHEANYKKDLMCTKGDLLMKIDACLLLFNILENKQEIGFVAN